MDWPLLSSGTFVALMGLIGIVLLWRERNPIFVSQDEKEVSGNSNVKNLLPDGSSNTQ